MTPRITTGNWFVSGVVFAAALVLLACVLALVVGLTVAALRSLL